MRDFTPEEVARHNALTDKAWKLIENEIITGEALPPQKLNWVVRRKLATALDCFEKALEINPESYSSLFAMGKIYQRLQQAEAAFQCFSRAHTFNPTQSDVAREAGLQALDLGKADEAMYFCETALRLAPDDPGHKANLAWAYLIANRIEEAQVAIEEAVNAAPDDEISQCVQQVINEVATGKRPVPKTLLEVCAYG